MGMFPITRTDSGISLSPKVAAGAATCPRGGDGIAFTPDQSGGDLQFLLT